MSQSSASNESWPTPTPNQPEIIDLVTDDDEASNIDGEVSAELDEDNEERQWCAYADEKFACQGGCNSYYKFENGYDCCECKETCCIGCIVTDQETDDAVCLACWPKWMAELVRQVEDKSLTRAQAKMWETRLEPGKFPKNFPFTNPKLKAKDELRKQIP